MRFSRPRPLGVFGRTYGLLVGTVLLAGLLNLMALILSAPPTPPIVEYAHLVARLSGEAGEASEAGLPLKLRIASERDVPQGSDDPSVALGLSLDRSLSLPPGTVRAKLGSLGPPSALGTMTPGQIVDGKTPLLVAGEFTLARPLGGGRWLILETDGSFAAAAAWRFALLFLGTLALVIPFAYLLARRMTLPISNFARAADRLGRDPRAPPLAEEGPREVRVASEVFNRMQRRLNSYIEERTMMVAAVAHDLRTPLMRMAFEAEDAPEKIRSALNKQIREMQQMIEAIMRFLKAEQSRHDRQLCNLGALVKEVVEDLIERPEDVTLNPFQGDLTLAADPIGLKSVFRNVIGNALTYGSRVVVSLTSSAGMAVVEVRDRGPGLSDADLDRVFQPFYRVEKSRNRRTGGIGLGLTVARSIVVAHGGRIAIANGDGGGLVATIELPLSQVGDFEELV